jgi:hypothetical protein
MESASSAFIGSTNSGRGAGDGLTGSLETPMPRRLNFTGPIFRLLVFFGAGTSVFARERLAALIVLPSGLSLNRKFQGHDSPML